MLNSSIFLACCGLFCAAGGVVFEVLRTGKGLQVVAFAFQVVVVLCLANSFCNLGWWCGCGIKNKDYLPLDKKAAKLSISAYQ